MSKDSGALVRRLPVVTVVGLGPAGAEFVLPATREILTEDSGVPVLFRTSRHPSAAELIEQLRARDRDVRSFDDLYEEGSSFEEVYESIVETIVREAVAHGHVIYAVPGSPVVAERTVDMLRKFAHAGPSGHAGALAHAGHAELSTPSDLAEPSGSPGSIELRLASGLSFCDLAWDRLRIDPVAAGVRLVDGLSFAWQAAGDPGPLLVGQCWSNAVLSEVKLALEVPAEGQRAVILHHLGLADERVENVPWQEIDRTLEADHLTTLFVPVLAAPVGGELMRLVDTIATLRRLCPWDREQTHRSLVRHLLEETYEAIEAIEALGDAPEAAPPEAVAHAEDELGDLLCQVVFHAGLAREEGLFDLSDIARANREKLVVRHPHVFADVRADSAAAVVRNWELIKEAERPEAGLLDGIPVALPALARVAKAERKLASAGLGWGQTGPRGGEGLVAGWTSGAAAGAEPGTDEERAAGEGLLALARELAHRGIDAESALRRSLDRLADRVRQLEIAAARDGGSLRGLNAEDRLAWFHEGPPGTPNDA